MCRRAVPVRPGQLHVCASPRRPRVLVLRGARPQPGRVRQPESAVQGVPGTLPRELPRCCVRASTPEPNHFCNPHFMSSAHKISGRGYQAIFSSLTFDSHSLPFSHHPLTHSVSGTRCATRPCAVRCARWCSCAPMWPTTGRSPRDARPPRRRATQVCACVCAEMARGQSKATHTTIAEHA